MLVMMSKQQSKATQSLLGNNYSHSYRQLASALGNTHFYSQQHSLIRLACLASALGNTHFYSQQHSSYDWHASLLQSATLTHITGMSHFYSFNSSATSNTRFYNYTSFSN
jgi:hypothetical protein